MRRLVFVLAALAVSACLVSCGKASEDIYSVVTLKAYAGDVTLVTIKVDKAIEGNFFRNLNTGEEYEYPLFTNGSCTFRVLKGVYIFAFDGNATLPDGTVRKVRCYAHRSPNDSVNILGDEITIKFDLLLL